jgi:DNA adenine methylase
MEALLKYFGGKNVLKNKIIPLIPEYKHFRSVFLGSGGVEFSLNPINTSEIWNDLDGELTNFYQVLQNRNTFEEFAYMCNLTLFSEVEFEQAKNRLEVPLSYFGPSVPRALAFFIRNRLSRGGDGKTFATSTKRLRRKMNEQVSAWLSVVEGLEEFHTRCRYVEIRKMHFREFIPKFQIEDSFFYLDPPYYPTTRVAGGYKFEMSQLEHEELLDLLANFNSKFLIHGYKNPIYTYYAQKNNWREMSFEVTKSSSSSKTKPKAIETVWINY